MEKRLKNYIRFLKDRIPFIESSEERERVRTELLIQIGFFQHERLVHLIVTALFSLIFILLVITSFFIQQTPLYILLGLVLILLIPYIRFYYILENGVQRLYMLYDELSY